MFYVLLLTGQTLYKNSILKSQKKLGGAVSGPTRGLTNTRTSVSCWLAANILLWKTAAHSSPEPEPQLKTLQPPPPLPEMHHPWGAVTSPGASEVTENPSPSQSQIFLTSSFKHNTSRQVPIASLEKLYCSLNSFHLEETLPDNFLLHLISSH